MINNYTGAPALKITGDTTEKKTIGHTESRALFGYLFDIYDANSDLFQSLGIDSAIDLYRDCMIQNNELRFFCGEGIDLGNGCRLDSIFLNKYGVLVYSVYDADDNELFYC